MLTLRSYTEIVVVGQGTTQNATLPAQPTTPTPATNQNGSNSNNNDKRSGNQRTLTAVWKGVASEYGQPTTKKANGNNLQLVSQMKILTGLSYL